MGVGVTLRDVPVEVRDELAVGADRAEKSLQEYLRGFLIAIVAKPGLDDMIVRARPRETATGVQVDSESILAARDAGQR